jgi:hypothetical protein
VFDFVVGLPPLVVFDFVMGFPSLVVFELVARLLPYQNRLIALPAYENPQPSSCS